ncbi:hypothetical protein [Hydrogenophaga sp.]|uniref:hypothetical protein n=1 Tax=Hydrogenophaga sp. TaxID=1904254 RepID=UPI003F7041AE
MKKTDLAGLTFGRWKVLHAAPTRVTPCGSKKAYWVCACECGTQDQVRAEHLKTGRSVSCGCWKAEAAAAQKLTHGGRRTPLYEVWTQMIQRCENPNNKRFADWGGRGIKVCERWHDFAAFRSDMGDPPRGHSIDRRNNDGHYEPGNCRWATPKQQAANKRPYGSGK